MYVFGSDTGIRGCFVTFDLQVGNGKGAYIEMAPDGILLPKVDDDEEAMIVTGLNFAEKDKIHTVQCFNNTIYTYAFGLDPASSSITVTYVGFLVDRSGSNLSDVIDRFTGAYVYGRVSNNQNYVKVVIGSNVLQGFLIGMESSTMDSQYNLQAFTMHLLVVEEL